MKTANFKKPELLAPAGNLEKLKIAIEYGADCVYIGAKDFSLRKSANNFDFYQMKEAVDFAHEKNKKVYLTANIMPHNEDIEKYPEFIKKFSKTGIDAVIVSDLGIFSLTKKFAPHLNIHISTQANNVNWASCKKWHEMGANRIILARELSILEISEIRQKIPSELEIEVFVHGAMCISYSGRCLLSKYLTRRDSNQGDCAQPCRWKYFLVEQNRQGEFLELNQEKNASFILNSKDLCMIEHIDTLIEAGVDSLKIEGRMKSEYYISTVVKAYREAIDNFFKSTKDYKVNKYWLKELEKVSNREYTTGFFLDKPGNDAAEQKNGGYIRKYDFLGIVKNYNENTKIALIVVKNKISLQDEVEIFMPKGIFFYQKIYYMKNLDEENIIVANVPNQTIKIKIDKLVTKNAIIRKKINNWA